MVCGVAGRGRSRPHAVAGGRDGPAHGDPRVVVRGVHPSRIGPAACHGVRSGRRTSHVPITIAGPYHNIRHHGQRSSIRLGGPVRAAERSAVRAGRRRLRRPRSVAAHTACGTAGTARRESRPFRWRAGNPLDETSKAALERGLHPSATPRVTVRPRNARKRARRFRNRRNPARLRGTADLRAPAPRRRRQSPFLLGKIISQTSRYSCSG